jgi:hypothetical protein
MKSSVLSPAGSTTNFIKNGPDEWVIELFGSSLNDIDETKKQKFAHAFVEVCPWSSTISDSPPRNITNSVKI